MMDEGDVSHLSRKGGVGGMDGGEGKQRLKRGQEPGL